MADMTSANRMMLAKMMMQQQQSANNGTGLGALASALAGGVAGYQMNKSNMQDEAAKKSLAGILSKNDPSQQAVFEGLPLETLQTVVAKRMGGEDAPGAVREYEYYNKLPDEGKKDFLNVKRAQQALNLGGSYGILGAGGNIEQQIPKTLPPQDMPENVAARKTAEVTAESGAKSDVAASSTLPVLEQLRAYNKGSFEMPYADTAPVRAYSRIFGSSEQQRKQTNVELLKQARTDLAAPLAKELGVNPTDKDFQASLERIFDSNASQVSRDAQINALEQRILKRKESRGRGSPIMPPPATGAISYEEYFR